MVARRRRSGGGQPVGPWSGAAARGFSLIELTISLAVASVGLLIAAGILVQAHRMLAQSAVDAASPVADLALLRLRADIQGAAGVDPGRGAGRRRPNRAGASATGPGTWSRDRLVLVRSDGSEVVYRKRGDRLERAVVEPGVARGTVSGWPVIRGLISWRWRETAPRLVTVEIVYDRPGPGRGRIVDPARRGRGAGERRTVGMSAAMRGGGLGWGW